MRAKVWRGSLSQRWHYCLWGPDLPERFVPADNQHATMAEAFIAAEVALFKANHPGCCDRCGWSLSSHGHSQYGLDCPWGVSPAAKRGHLHIVRRANEALA